MAEEWQPIEMSKIIFVAHWDWVLYNYRLPLAHALREEGYELQLVSPPGDYVNALRAQGFNWTEWRVSRRSLNPIMEIAAVVRLGAIYREARPDVVHHFTIKPNLYGSIAAWFTRVPSVINTFTGLGFVFSQQLLARFIRVLMTPLMRLVFANQRVWTVFQIHADRDRLISQRIVHPRRTSVIAGSGVAIPHGEARRVRRTSTTPTVLMAARLLHEKGLADLIAAAEILKQRRIAVRVLVAGAPDPGNPDSVAETDVDRWSQIGVVEFLGHRNNIRSLLAEAAVAVLPSYSEGIPKFLLEAAAAGLPLVATNIPGCSMIVKEGVNGRLVPTKNPVALADALEGLLRDPVLREKYGAASLDLVRENFSEEKVIDAYKDLYRSCLLRKQQ